MLPSPSPDRGAAPPSSSTTLHIDCRGSARGVNKFVSVVFKVSFMCFCIVSSLHIPFPFFLYPSENHRRQSNMGAWGVDLRQLFNGSLGFFCFQYLFCNARHSVSCSSFRVCVLEQCSFSFSRSHFGSRPLWMSSAPQ